LGLRHSEISEVYRPSRLSRPLGCDVEQVSEVLPWQDAVVTSAAFFVWAQYVVC
jgi:hypothetical protein